MKNVILRIEYLLAFLFCMTACFEDDSTPGTNAVGNIEIEGLHDTSIISYSGHMLDVSPRVNAGYPEEQLSYAWYMYNQEDVNSVSGKGLANGYRENKIAEGKDLSYEVNLPSGVYTFIFEVMSKDNSYTQTASLKLTVSTAFSRGFYILKETAFGGSEVDLYTQDGLNSNLMEKLTGAELEGKPVNLSFAFNQAYIDEEEQEMASTKMLNVFTEKDYRAFRTEDMRETFNRTNLLFEEMDVDERAYTMINGFFTMFYLSSKGLYSGTPGDMSPNSGRFGLPMSDGASKFFQSLGGGMAGYAYWNEKVHRVYITDYNCVSANSMDYEMLSGVNEADLECIASGLNYVGGSETVWFLAKDKLTSSRYLYLLEGGMGEVTDIRRLDAGLHVAQADVVVGNALSAMVIYSVHENRLYAYNWMANSEYEVPLPGVSNHETIGYVSNQYLHVGIFGDRSDNYDYLLVGTQEGEGYKLYFYDNLVGGSPKQEAIIVAEGTGKVKSVRYVPTISLGSFDMMPMFDSAPVFPFGE